MATPTPAFETARTQMIYRNDVMTYFQPLCSVGPTPVIVGFEALSRKPGKNGQIISIFDLLPIKRNDNISSLKTSFISRTI